MLQCSRCRYHPRFMGQADPMHVRWRAAGALRRLPEFRGRDRLEGLILGNIDPPAGVHEGTFGPGLRFRVRYRDDAHLKAFHFLRFEAPSLAPVLEAVLEEGDVFIDVGANVGVHAGWAARLVGRRGYVHAFEPVPDTLEFLREFVALNELDQVRVIPLAVGATAGEVTLTVVPEQSGISSAVPSGSSEPASRFADIRKISVRATTLDDYVSEHLCTPISLIKIDVEGWEFEVLRGAERLLSADTSPAIVFESQASTLSRAGTSPAQIVDWLSEFGYNTYALTPTGLHQISPSVRAVHSTNALALHSLRHRQLHARLATVRFRRNQTC